MKGLSVGPTTGARLVFGLFEVKLLFLLDLKGEGTCEGTPTIKLVCVKDKGSGRQ